MFFYPLKFVNRIKLNFKIWRHRHKFIDKEIGSIAYIKEINRHIEFITNIHFPHINEAVEKLKTKRLTPKQIKNITKILRPLLTKKTVKEIENILRTSEGKNNSFSDNEIQNITENIPRLYKICLYKRRYIYPILFQILMFIPLFPIIHYHCNSMKWLFLISTSTYIVLVLSIVSTKYFRIIGYVLSEPFRYGYFRNNTIIYPSKEKFFHIQYLPIINTKELLSLPNKINTFVELIFKANIKIAVLQNKHDGFIIRLIISILMPLILTYFIILINALSLYIIPQYNNNNQHIKWYFITCSILWVIYCLFEYRNSKDKFIEFFGIIDKEDFFINRNINLLYPQINKAFFKGKDVNIAIDKMFIGHLNYFEIIVAILFIAIIEIFQVIY